MTDTRYEDMSDDDLHDLSAEIMGWKKIPFKQASNYEEACKEYRHYFCWVDDKNNHQFFLKALDAEMLECEYWNPTHKDSNQIQNYIFPKIGKRWVIEETYEPRDYSIFLVCQGEACIRIGCDDDDKINRVKLIACLKAWDQINKLKED